MTEPKFTNGDWLLPHFVTAEDETDCMCQFVLNERYSGCIATVEYGETDNPPIEEAKANAMLICAAPDLFKVCSTIVHDYEGDGMEGMRNRDVVFYEMARKAIKKALVK